MENENSKTPITENTSEERNTELFPGEDVDVKENVTWIDNRTTVDFTCEEMAKWKREGSNDEYYHFCNTEVLNGVIEAKNALPKDITDGKYKRAREKSNPFEKIRNVFFVNRASLKMANIDTVTDYMFTKINQNVNFVNKPGPCYFADVCAGPGGFSEYILWRTNETFKGFGFTLKRCNDFNLDEKSVCASTLPFRPCYGARGDGDVYDPNNIKHFKNVVLQDTDNEGVHFVMSDGGFETNGREDQQEVLSKRIYTCQCLVALEILRTHGHFVTKLFDVFTCFSVGLVYLMYKCFEKICILKPNTSRPANSERYLICAGLKDSEQVQEIRNYLRSIVARFWELGDDQCLNITEIVPLDMLRRDQHFYTYICDTNNRIARRQTVHLKKFLAFFKDGNLKDKRQEQFRKDCLEYWKIPDVIKNNYEKRGNFLRDEYVQMHRVMEMYPKDFSKLTPNPNQWHYTFLQSKECTQHLSTFFAVQKDNVMRLGVKGREMESKLKLTRGTVLFGELVKEACENEDSSHLQHKYSLHVIDALRLGADNLAGLTLEERISKIEMYCKTVNREWRGNTMRVRAKGMRSLNLLMDDYQNLVQNRKGNYEFNLPVLGRQNRRQFYDVNSVLLVKTDPNEQSCAIRFKMNEPTLKDEDILQKYVEFIKTRTHCKRLREEDAGGFTEEK